MKAADIGSALGKVAFAVVVVLFARGAVHLAGNLVNEIKFYRSRRWNFDEDNGQYKRGQAEFVRACFFLPLGVAKLLYHSLAVTLSVIVAWKFGLVWLGMLGVLPRSS